MFIFIFISLTNFKIGFSIVYYYVTMDEKVIDRIEKKYLITKGEKRSILKSIRKNMKKDKYHKSKVLNLYFDNDNFDLISQSIDWVDFKEKLRARSYGGFDRVFLEIKTKIHGDEGDNLGYKRRVMITHDDFNELIKGKRSVLELSKRAVETSNDFQIAKEVDYLINHFSLKPKVLVTYNRESYKDEHGLRITFDDTLKYRSDKLSFHKSRRDKMYFKDKNTIIMEIKAHGAIPLWLVRTMSELKVYPERFSKIGKIYELIRKENYVQ